MMESDEFRGLTPAEKCAYWSILSEFNKPRLAGQGPLYKSDADFAVRLGVSTKTFREARRKFKALGWVTYTEGRQARGRNLATAYNAVKWAKVAKGQTGERFVQMGRFCYEMLLNKVREDAFNLRDLVTYCSLTYWRDLNGRLAENNKKFFITKDDLARLTGFPEAYKHAKRLQDGFQYREGSRLFRLSVKGGVLFLDKWALPGENEEIRAVWEESVAKSLSERKSRTAVSRSLDALWDKTVRSSVPRWGKPDPVLPEFVQKYGARKVKQMLTALQAERGTKVSVPQLRKMLDGEATAPGA